MRIIRLTSEPVRVAATPTKQELRLACDVLGFDELDLVLTIHEGSSLVVKIITAMNIDDDTQGWVDAVTFSSLSENNSEKKNVPNILRYVRWETTSSAAGTFSITGIGRRWA